MSVKSATLNVNEVIKETYAPQLVIHSERREYKESEQLSNVI